MMRGLATAVLALCAYGAHAIPLRHITSRKGVPLGDEQPELAFRIVGGAGVEKPVPYMAQVFNKVADNETVQCGGTLISPTQVLTAAHCLFDVAGERMPHRLDKPKKKGGKTVFKTVVYIGGLKGAGQSRDKDGEAFGVTSVDCHAGFDMDTLRNDICILELSSVCIRPPVDLNIRWSANPMSTSNAAVTAAEAPGITATALGWGIYDKDGNKSSTLRSVDVPVLDDKVCDKLYRHYDASIGVCAGGDRGKDTCEGDSGGPLLAPDGTQIGITGYGKGCGKVNVPTVYTRISAYSDWIRKRLQ